MCGINGILQFRRNFDSVHMKNIVRAMNKSIVHRGPDDEGIYSDDLCALGIRRLSIIDLQTGSQPIWNEKRNKLIIFNGELYNYKSLKQELISNGHKFYTNSDTEVILHGYESFGINFLTKMEGMFAFAIYDLNTNTLTLARDRAGEKPLYYYLSDKFLLFSSELKSLLVSGLVPREINVNAMSQYFQLTYIPAPECIIKGVKKLMPASIMTVDLNGKCMCESYWRLVIRNDDALKDYDTCKKLLRDALFNSVEQRMTSDVPIGTFLSGGFDSTIISGIMSRISTRPVDAFTIGFREKQYDESSLAKLSAAKNKLNHRIIMLDSERLASEVKTVLNNIDEPFADSSLIVTYAVSKATREYVKVVLTGDAGDELFAGYNKYLISFYGSMYRKIPALFRKGLIEPAAKLLPSRSGLSRKINKVINSSDSDDFQQRKKLMRLGFKACDLEKLMQDSFVDPLNFIDEYYHALPDYADDQLRAQYVDLNILLEGDMLTKVDRASMLASLETRVPMLDSKVIELAFNIPTRFKINGTKRKIILKDTFRDLIPDEIFSAPKHGFDAPVAIWLETFLRDKLLEFASKDYLDAQGLFNAGYINRLITEHLSRRKNFAGELWVFYVFQDWYARLFS